MTWTLSGVTVSIFNTAWFMHAATSDFIDFILKFLSARYINMARSPSPPPRAYDRPSGSRPQYRDRPNRSYNANAGPSRYAEDDRDRRRVDPRDTGGYDRNAGRTWGNYRSRREEQGVGFRARSRSRSRSVTPDRERGERSRRDSGHGRSRPAVSNEGSARVAESPARSRATGSVTPEEGQISSPLKTSGSLPNRPVSPARSRRRSPSPPRRDQGGPLGREGREGGRQLWSQARRV